MKKGERITTTKSALARELDASPASITNLVRRAVIKPLPDGKLDRKAALTSIAGTSGIRGGWTGCHQGNTSLAQRAQELLKQPVSTSPNPREDDQRAEREFFFGCGAAFVAVQLRDASRIKIMGQIAHEAIGVSKVDGCNLAKVFVHLVGGWLADYVVETAGPEYGREFREELEAWVDESIPYEAGK